jgi:hypothetical protein
MRVSSGGDWQLRLCSNPACITTVLRVRRDSHDCEHWWVSRLDYSGAWRIAGSEPTCPLCGSNLEVGVQANDNVG